jgi:hypothetical protein
VDFLKDRHGRSVEEKAAIKDEIEKIVGMTQRGTVRLPQ